MSSSLNRGQYEIGTTCSSFAVMNAGNNKQKKTVFQTTIFEWLLDGNIKPCAHSFIQLFPLYASCFLFPKQQEKHGYSTRSSIIIFTTNINFVLIWREVSETQ